MAPSAPFDAAPLFMQGGRTLEMAYQAAHIQPATPLAGYVGERKLAGIGPPRPRKLPRRTLGAYSTWPTSQNRTSAAGGTDKPAIWLCAPFHAHCGKNRFSIAKKGAARARKFLVAGP